MNASTLDSIRRLAERPGTEHEGIVAREMLKKLESKSGSFADKLRAGTLKSLDEILRENGVPTDVKCPCGESRKIFAGPCQNHAGHAKIHSQIRETFKRGEKVFYNFWAYEPNDPGIFAAHIPMQKVSGTFPWAWCSVKFDRLKSARRIPILNDAGVWCLTKERK